MNRTMERLVTGKRINRTSDDPSGAIAVSAFKQDQRKLTADIAGKEREMKRLGAYEGAGSVVSEMLTDLQAMVTGAANAGGLSKEEREAMAMEAGSIIKTIDYLAMIPRLPQQIRSPYTAHFQVRSQSRYSRPHLRTQAPHAPGCWRQHQLRFSDQS